MNIGVIFKNKDLLGIGQVPTNDICYIMWTVAGAPKIQNEQVAESLDAQKTELIWH